MRIKKTSVLYAFFIFVCLCTLMYFMLDTSSTERGSGRFGGVAEVNIELQAKIQSIEEDIARNSETLKLIRDAIADIVKNRTSPHADLDSLAQRLDELRRLANKRLVGGDRVKIDRPSIRLPPDMCPAQGWTLGKLDVSIMNLYQKLPFDNPDGGSWKQGFPITYDANQWAQQKLKVIVVPHSHQDPGWRKTLNEYFNTESKKSLDSMLAKLRQYPDMTFIYAEMAFFSMWWNTLNKQSKEQVKELVGRKQLEIVTGGWVMNDEANTHYHAMVDQLIEGHQWLIDNLGIRPNTSWAIDPFGHSPTMAYLLRKSGMRHMLIQRVHYSIKKHLAKQKQLEFMWRQQWDASGKWDIFTHMMPFYSYDQPHTCGPEPAVCCQFDFLRLPGSRNTCPWKIPPQHITETNVEERSRTLLDQYRKKSTLYRSKVVLIPLGDDFRYTTLEEWDKQHNNYRKLMDYMNKREDWHVEISFGTLSDYFQAVQERMGQSRDMPKGFPTLGGDMFSYADREDHYWSGYYTSRPFFKRMDRVLEAELRSAEILYSLAVAHSQHEESPKLRSSSFPTLALLGKLTTARRQLGLFQHHDGITGTSKDHVVNDYGDKLLEGVRLSREVMAVSTQYLLTKERRHFLHELVFDLDEVRDTHDSLPRPRVIELDPSGAPRHVFLLNPLAQPQTTLVRMHVSSPRVQVRNAGNQVIRIQVDPHFETATETTPCSDHFVLRFPVELPPLGLERFTLKMLPVGDEEEDTLGMVTEYNSRAGDATMNKRDGGVFKVNRREAETFTLENSFIKVAFDPATAMMKSYEDKTTGKSTRLEVQFVSYGTTKKSDKSGAYLFLPDGDAKPLQYEKPVIQVIRGSLYEEARIILPHVTHSVRLYNSPGIDSTFIEVDNTVDIRSTSNFELVMRVITDIENTKKQFYTDLNCFQYLRREPLTKLPPQANVYPMPCAGFLEGSITGGAHTRLSVLSGQPSGVGSGGKQGQLEIFLDRRLNQDDNRGVAQGVTDNRVTPNLMRILMESLQQTASSGEASSDLGHLTPTAQLVLNDLLYPPHRLPVLRSFDKADSQLLPRLTLMTGQGLPCDYHLVNLRSVANALHRPALILHRYRAHCGAPWMQGSACWIQKDGQIALTSLFNDLVVSKVEPTTLTLLHDSGVTIDTSKVSVEPMELETFRILFR